MHQFPRVVLRPENIKHVDLALDCSRTQISGAGNAPVPRTIWGVLQANVVLVWAAQKSEASVKNSCITSGLAIADRSTTSVRARPSNRRLTGSSCFLLDRVRGIAETSMTRSGTKRGDSELR